MSVETIEDHRALTLLRDAGGTVIAKGEPKGGGSSLVEFITTDGKRYRCFTESPELFPSP